MPRLCKIVIFLLLFTLSCGRESESTAFIDLSGTWELTSIVPQRINKTQASTMDIALPGSWTGLVKQNRDLVSLIELKKEVFIGEDLRGKLLALSLGTIAVADETYFNGVKVGSMGKLPERGTMLTYDFAWIQKRNYTIPPSLVKINQANEIKIKVFSHILNGIKGDLYIGNINKTNRALMQVRNLLAMDAKSIIINIILGIFFIIILEAYKKRLTIFYTVLILTLMTIGQLNIMGFNYEDGLTRIKIILSIFIFGYLFFTMCVEEFFETSCPYSRTVLLLLVFIVETAIIVSPDSKSLIYYAGTATLVLNIIMVIYYTIIFFLALRKNFKRYWIFLLFTIPLVITTVPTYIHFFKMEFHKMSSVFLFHLPMVLIGLLLVLLVDYINVHTEMNIMKGLLIFKTKTINQITRKLKKTEKEEPKEKLHDLIRHLDDNYVDKYNRSELAQKFELNEDYMCQLFKKRTGQTISNYINQRRIMASEELLLNTDSKIIDIAYHVGFESLVHFHREFKKKTNMTPQNYRLKHTSSKQEKPQE